MTAHHFLRKLFPQLRAKPFSFAFPDQVVTPRQRVLYALWHEGEQTFCRLQTLTKLPDAQLSTVLHELVDENVLFQRNVPPPEGAELGCEIHGYGLMTQY